jgi:predicted anti-sigma-YlaC factor YlaD
VTLPRSSGCERARAYISLELDGELSRFEHALLGSHLARCGACSSYRAEVGAITTRLRTTPPVELARPTTLPQRRRAYLDAGAAASVAAAVMLVVGIGSLVTSVRTQRTAAPASTQPAYLQSVDYELQWLERARPYNRAPGAI